MGFTKLDEGIVFSSIMSEDDSVFKVFSIFLATCKSNGISPVSPIFISSITKKSIEEVMRCILVLESPDPLSRSTAEDGRRIRKVDGGYFIINYQKYRNFTYSDNSEAVRKRSQRNDRDILGHVPPCPDTSGHVTTNWDMSRQTGTCHDKLGHSASVFNTRSNSFKEEVNKYNTIYHQNMLDDFTRYWTEPNKSGTKMRFELERTWDLSRRLETWSRNDKTFNKQSGAPLHDYQRKAAGKYKNMPIASN